MMSDVKGEGTVTNDATDKSNLEIPSFKDEDSEKAFTDGINKDIAQEIPEFKDSTENLDQESLTQDDFNRLEPIPGEIPEFNDDVNEGRTPDTKIESNINIENSLEKISNEYIQDLKEYSEYPETVSEKPFDTSDLHMRTPLENAKLREEFSEIKTQLKSEWEAINGRSWPKYDHDVYSDSGKLIRKAGSDYDAHHIHPLGMGGKNEASNIAPLNAEVHYDKQGIHAPDSPYSKLNQILGGRDL